MTSLRDAYLDMGNDQEAMEKPAPPPTSQQQQQQQQQQPQPPQHQPVFYNDEALTNQLNGGFNAILNSQHTQSNSILGFIKDYFKNSDSVINRKLNQLIDMTKIENLNRKEKPSNQPILKTVAVGAQKNKNDSSLKTIIILVSIILGFCILIFAFMIFKFFYTNSQFTKIKSLLKKAPVLSNYKNTEMKDLHRIFL